MECRHNIHLSCLQILFFCILITITHASILKQPVNTKRCTIPLRKTPIQPETLISFITKMQKPSNLRKRNNFIKYLLLRTFLLRTTETRNIQV